MLTSKDAKTRFENLLLSKQHNSTTIKNGTIKKMYMTVSPNFHGCEYIKFEISTTINLIDLIKIVKQKPLLFAEEMYKFNKCTIHINYECLQNELTVRDNNEMYEKLNIYDTHVTLKEQSMVTINIIDTDISKILNQMYNLNIKKCVYKSDTSFLQNANLQNVKFKFHKNCTLNLPQKSNVINNNIIKKIKLDTNFYNNINSLYEHKNVEEIQISLNLLQLPYVSIFFKFFPNTYRININYDSIYSNNKSANLWNFNGYNFCGMMLRETFMQYPHITILQLCINRFRNINLPLINCLLSCTTLIQLIIMDKYYSIDDFDINQIIESLITTSLCININVRCKITSLNFEKLLQLESSKIDTIKIKSLQIDNPFPSFPCKDQINELCHKYPNHPLLQCVHGLSLNNHNNVCKYNKLLSEYF